MSRFKLWFEENLSNDAKNIAKHGADKGYTSITYYNSTTKLFNKYNKDITAMLITTSDDFGYDNTIELLKSFNHQDMLDGFFRTLRHDDSSKCLLVWFACETLAHEQMDRINI